MKNKKIMILALTTTLAFGALGTVFAKTEMMKPNFQNLKQYVGEEMVPEEEIKSKEEVKKSLEEGKNLPGTKENYEKLLDAIQKYNCLPEKDKVTLGEEEKEKAKEIEKKLNKIDEEMAKEVESKILPLFEKDERNPKEVLEAEEALLSLNGTQESILEEKYPDKLDTLRQWADDIREP
ncbi:MAG: hypothetical protein Q4Q07_07020 [Tissierellia bacterium]|nr:hypothetical protein [Tissierellia bacterium]